jgi:cytochrome d ubiquinol oxidase subunit II
VDLHVFWFLILGLLLTGYGVLDGFDLGVGILHLGVRKDEERRLLMNSIGPLWDGNEVWLVVLGGALFSAFPKAYAAVFSALYLPFMLILFALIFRAVSLEFRGKQDGPLWRAFWDSAFCVASTAAAFLFGVIVGTSILGLPIDKDGEFTGTLLDVFRPSSLLTGVFAVSVFAMHGSIYLYLKTEGELQQRIHGWMWTTFGLFLTMYLFVTIVTLTTVPASREKYEHLPWYGAAAVVTVVVLNVLAIANIPRAIYLGKPFYAFVSSSCTIAAFTFLFGANLFPNLLVSTTNPEYSLTVYNAASSDATLVLMAVIALLGMPFVLSYTVTVYYIFRGKVRLGKYSY